MDKLRKMAAKLEAGVKADIWYDAHAFDGSEKEAKIIDNTQNAMLDAAKFIRGILELATQKG